jgi:hypothetical protein
MKFRQQFIFPTILLVMALPVGGNQETMPSSDEADSDLTVTLVLKRAEIHSGQAVPVDVLVHNTGSTPLLIGNLIVRGGGGLPVSRIQFELRDDRGHVIPPDVEMIADSFSAKKEPNPATAFLSSYLLLHPGYSLTTEFLLDVNLFKDLAKPGYYRLSATYTSNGLSYPPVYHNVGLSDEDIKSLPFKAWSGKLATNEVRFKIMAARTAH